MKKSWIFAVVATAAVGIVSGLDLGAQEQYLQDLIDPLSNAPIAKCFNSGTGANKLTACVSDHGNLVKFESPAGFDHIGQQNLFRDGYAICTGNLPTIPNESHGYDTGGIEAGFGPATIVDPSPLTISRDTTNGVFRLIQKFRVDKKEKEVLIEMTLMNISGVAREAIKLQRAFEGDVDNNNNAHAFFGRTVDSAFEWVDQPAASSGAAGHGLMLTAVDMGVDHATVVNTIADYNPTGSGQRTGNGCIVFFQGVATPASNGANLVGRVIYGLGTIPAGGQKTVSVSYRRY
jgi:hypothetical protein